MWSPYDHFAQMLRQQADPAYTRQPHAAPTRTVISVVLTADVETNADVIACTVAAIQAPPNVADVTTRKVRARQRPTQLEPTP